MGKARRPLIGALTRGSRLSTGIARSSRVQDWQEHNKGTDQCYGIPNIEIEGLLERPTERSSRHREQSKHDISRIPCDERKGSEQLINSEVRGRMRPFARPFAFARTACLFTGGNHDRR
jgi:hypothetical protein